MNRSRLSRAPLSKHAGVLRNSLLLSLGLSPLACGGSTALPGSNGGGGSAQQQATAGKRDFGQAGAASGAGAPSGGYGGYTLGNGGGPIEGGNAAVGGTPAQAGAGTGGVSAAGTGGVSAAGAGGRSAAGAGGVSSAGTGGVHIAGSGGMSHAGAGGAIDTTACPDPVFNPTSKLTNCGNGRMHRPTAIACTFTGTGGTPGIGGAGGASAGGSGGNTYCTSDAECASLPLGFCYREGNAAPVCKAGCVSDAECGGGVCACDGTHPGHCVPAGCHTDADCGPTSLCAVASGICGGLSFQCISPQDQCVSNSECPGGTCAMSGDHRACSNTVCGRPFLVNERARMAAVETRADWLDAQLTPDISELTPLERARLAAHWAHLAQMEHASIAAFARFNLQLLSLGAPSDLVEACNRALADETAHARTCFALASSYGGSAIGPARLDIEHCFEDTSLVAVAKLVLREGCLGEAVAALEATSAAEISSDRAVRQALTRIAQDELEHAQLAFRFVRWALSVSGNEVRAELAREAAEQLAEFERKAQREPQQAKDDRLAAHGLLGGDALRAIHLTAVRDVTGPLLRVLFEAEASQLELT